MVRILAACLVWLLSGPGLAGNLDPTQSTIAPAFTQAQMNADAACGKIPGSDRCGGKCVRCNAACAQSGSCAPAPALSLSSLPQQGLSSSVAPRFDDEPRAPDAHPPKRRFS